MSELLRQINKNIQIASDFTAIVDQGEDNSFTYAQFDACARRILLRKIVPVQFRVSSGQGSFQKVRKMPFAVEITSLMHFIIPALGLDEQNVVCCIFLLF